jgi:hypothetical protein
VADHRRVTVIHHDIVTSRHRLPVYGWVYARCLLAHVQGPERVLADAAKALGVGGALVVEEIGRSGQVCC